MKEELSLKSSDFFIFYFLFFIISLSFSSGLLEYFTQNDFITVSCQFGIFFIFNMRGNLKKSTTHPENHLGGKDPVKRVFVQLW